MIEKLKFVSIVGPKEDIDRVTVRYLSRYVIHLENALTELHTSKTLTPYVEANPYRDKLESIEKIIGFLPAKSVRSEGQGGNDRKVSLDEVLQVIREIREPLQKLRKEKEGYEDRRKQYGNLRDTAAPFRDLPVRFSTLRSYRFIRARFGRIPIEDYRKFQKYIYEDNNTIFRLCSKNDQYVWGVYFTPAENAAENDDEYKSFHFERIEIPEELNETPEEEFNDNSWKVEEMDVRIDRVGKQITELLNGHEETLRGAKETLEMYAQCFDIRKYAACTKAGGRDFYILCGWMPEQEAEAFEREVDEDVNVFCTMDDTDVNPDIVPPTKLKNPKPFRPFELFVRMYGLPRYDEFDPTIYVALTYSFIFGIMFGDVGQGLCFVIGGFLIYHYRHKDLAAIIGSAGIFSVI